MSDATPTRWREFWAGARAIFPLVVGAIPFAIIFGALGTTSGLSPGGAMAMSIIVFAGASQFVAVNLIAAGASPALIILSAFIVNLRHTLYGATLSPHVKHLPQRWLIPLGFWLTDESFVVSVAHYNAPDSAPHKHWFQLGSSLSMYVNWNIFTLVGILAGQHIQNPQSWGLDFAFVVTFIGMLIPFIRTRPVLISVIVSGIVATVTNPLPNKLGLILAALAGVIAGVYAESRQPQAVAAPTQNPQEANS